jgi:hypothetical protein
MFAILQESGQMRPRYDVFMTALNYDNPRSLAKERTYLFVIFKEVNMRRILLVGVILGVMLLGLGTARGGVAAAPPQPEAPVEPAVCSALAADGGTAFRSTLIATKDSYVNSNAPDTNYGTVDNLRAGPYFAIPSGTYYSYVAFNLSSLPADAIILTATMELYRTTAGSVSLSARALTEDWSELGVTWNTNPASTTTDEAVGIFSGDWYRWDIAAIVQKWRATPATNYGVRLATYGTFITPYSAHYFSSREGANPPRLVVEYVLRTTLTADADTQVSQASPTTNYGSATTLAVKPALADDAIHALLRFDTSGIPTGSTIVSATVGVANFFNRLQSPAEPQAITVAPEAVLAAWSQMGVTWDTAPGSESRGDPGVAAGQSFWSWFDVTNIVHAWASEDLFNYGIKLKAASGTESMVFYSRESTSPSNPPQLIITYGPPPCYSATSVNIGGATQGITDTPYTFNASLLPVTVTPPIVYTWQADEQSAVSGQQSAVTYTWATTGTKTITVTVENCESSVVDTHQIVINAPAPACEFPLTGLTLDGPATGIVETEYMYTATPIPANATTPITYTWQADEQLAVSGQASVTYTWTTPGTKAITVTAQNCGGMIVQHYSVNVQSRPDLTISGAWYNLAEQRVYYILKNVGAGTAPAGHVIRLFRDGSGVGDVTFDALLPPGATRSGSFAYPWTCAGATAQVRVCADATGIIPEDSEVNNCFEQTWSCDLVPPQITSGPTVSAIGETSATISWTTNEPCTSRLDYGRNGPFNIQSIPDNTFKTNHQVVLTGLNSGSVYYYKVSVTDAADNLNTSGGAFFETLPVGSGPVELGVIGIQNYRPPATEAFEFFTLYAYVNSNVAGVDRVAFFLNGKLVGRDHSPTGNRYEVHFSPAAWGLTRDSWYGQDHTLQVQAYNLLGEPAVQVATVQPEPTRLAPGRALITSPGSGYEMLIDGAVAPSGTTLKVWGYGVEYLWKCESEAYDPNDIPPGLEYVDCGEVRQKAQNMRLYLGTTQVGSDYTPADGEFSHQFTVDLAGKSAGTYTLMFIITLSDGRTMTAERQIVLKQGVGELALERTVTRDGTAFKVDLTLENVGSGTVYVDYMDDYAYGFRVAEKETPGYLITALGSAGTPHHTFRIDFRSGSDTEIALTPGAKTYVTYKLVPVLYQQIEFVVGERYYIGVGASPINTAFITYRLGTGGTLTRPFYVDGNVIDGIYVDDAVRQAYAAADYLIITSPGRLWSLATLPTWRAHAGKEREFNLVLSGMADLASLRNGVLGFLPSEFTAAELDALLEPGGRWANTLHPNFRGYNGTGYVLFVGEDKIIPSQGAGYEVPYSDLRYASTSGQAKPELVLGRIPGDDLGTLSQGLQNSILVARSGSGFDRKRALLTSGRGEGVIAFNEDIIEFRSLLNHQARALVHWQSYSDMPAVIAEISDNMADGQSFVLYRGHAGGTSWGDAAPWTLGTGDVASFDFHGYHPLVYALACQSGNYRDHYSMAEAWLRYGAGGYIGAVSNSYRHSNTYAGRAFLNRWGDNDALMAGSAMNDMARDHWADSWYWKRWIYQYHFFGDPKFGAMPILNVAAAQAAVLDGPVGTLALTLPDYTVTTDEDGWDRVLLPDGGVWSVFGDYVVPTWKATYAYPVGQRVQTVTLTAQGGLAVTTGLSLPVTTEEIDCDCAASPTASNVARSHSANGWFPEFPQPYEWQVVDNPDGTSTLELTLYPFTYNPATTDARFYKEWSFDIDVFSSTVDIVSLRPAQLAYGLTENVTATLLVNNSGAEQMFVAQTVVRSLSEDVETTLPLRALRALTGTALIDLVITDTLAAGDYVLDVTLLDMEGRVLDTELTEFTVGIVSGEVTGLTATPALFKPGDNIALALTFQNTGDVPLNGVAVLRVEGDTVTETVEFTHTLTALAPGATTTFNNVWNSTGATGETYRVVGYVTHEFGAFAPQEAMISTRAYIYLPLVLRSSD